MEITGDLIITNQQDATEYFSVKSITGNLDIRFPFVAPALTRVGGNLTVQDSLSAPALLTIIGWLYVWTDFDAPLLGVVEGSMSVSSPFTAPSLTRIGQHLGTRSDFNAPLLGLIGGEVTVLDGEFNAPALRRVLRAFSTNGGHAHVPHLARVGSLWVTQGGPGLDAPGLTHVDHLIEARAPLSAPELTYVGGSIFLADDSYAPQLSPGAIKLAQDSYYQLWYFRAAGQYRAGCREFDREEASEHYARSATCHNPVRRARGKLFFDAITNHHPEND